MRKLILSLFCMLTAVNVSSQEALWGSSSILSPEILGDNKVTFRTHAPKAVKVEVVGDFLPPRVIETSSGTYELPGTAQLTELQGGLWEYTTREPLVSELYNYTFVVDGQRTHDPSNMAIVRDVATVTNYFIIPGGQGDLYKVQDVPHGTVARRWYYSPALKEQRRITIYTPPGYEEGKKSYPVFYLLHGSGGDEEAWVSLGRTAQIIDNLIAQGKVIPMILVMPNGHTQNAGAPLESSRDYTPMMGGGPRKAVSSMEDSFMDVMAFVENNYRVKEGKANRAIAGLSMGGMHSAAISAKYPGTFDYIGIFSAPPVVPLLQSKYVDNYDTIDKFLAGMKVQQMNGFKLYWVACGESDFLFESVTESLKNMDEIGFKYNYHESEGGHIWKNWRIYLSEFLPMLFK